MTQHYAVGEVVNVDLTNDVATFSLHSVLTDPLMYPQRLAHPGDPEHYHTYPAPGTVYGVPGDDDNISNWFIKFYHPWAMVIPKGQSAEDVSSTNHEDVDLAAFAFTEQIKSLPDNKPALCSQLTPMTDCSGEWQGAPHHITSHHITSHHITSHHTQYIQRS